MMTRPQKLAYFDGVIRDLHLARGESKAAVHQALCDAYDLGVRESTKAVPPPDLEEGPHEPVR